MTAAAASDTEMQLRTLAALEFSRNERTRRFLDEVGQGPFPCTNCGVLVWTVAVVLDPGTEVWVDEELFEHKDDCTRGDWT